MMCACVGGGCCGPRSPRNRVLLGLNCEGPAYLAVPEPSLVGGGGGGVWVRFWLGAGSQWETFPP